MNRTNIDKDLSKSFIMNLPKDGLEKMWDTRLKSVKEVLIKELNLRKTSKK